jgi:hypothetical protein
VKKAKKKEKPKLSFEEDEEDVPSGSKRSRSPSTGTPPYIANTIQKLRFRIGTKETIHKKSKCGYFIPTRPRERRRRTYRT